MKTIYLADTGPVEEVADLRRPHPRAAEDAAAVRAAWEEAGRPAAFHARVKRVPAGLVDKFRRMARQVEQVTPSVKPGPGATVTARLAWMEKQRG